MTIGPDTGTGEPQQPSVGKKPHYVDEVLRDAERLIHYAAETGVDIGADTRTAVLHARMSADQPDERSVANLLNALTSLTAKLRPVTAESLRACSSEEQHIVHNYWAWAVGLAAFIVPFSFASFVTSGIADAIRKDVDTANQLAVKLTTQLHSPWNGESDHGRSQAVLTPPAAPSGSLGPCSPTLALHTFKDAAPQAPPKGVSAVDVVAELQQFAALTRAIDGRALRLNILLFGLGEKDPYQSMRTDPACLHETFQLPLELPSHLSQALSVRIVVFQDVRYFAQRLLDDVSLLYGGIATCVLPVLYALLGACAYLLRTFDEQTKTKTFVPSVANSARFVIAAIGGAVVGLFNSFTITQSATIPPLAIAFLVGYAVDVFFSFLESLLQTFGKARAAAPATAAPPATASTPAA